MKRNIELGEARRYPARYLFALVLAVLMGLGAAVPVFAAEQDEQVQPQIIGGTEVSNGQFPFMVSMQANTSGSPPYQEHFCGGSLIDSNSILTAAHCVDFIGQTTVPGATLSFRAIRIVVGTTVLNSDQGQARRISALSDIRIHPSYNGARSSRYDAAVITLSSPVTGLDPIARARPGFNGLEKPGRLAGIAGWGNRVKQDPDGSQPDSFPNRMRVAYPPIVSDATGERVYEGSYFAPQMVSAGKEGKDTCQGDSGGPMWVATDAGRRQIGITSFGAGCGARGFPGVYTEVNEASINNFIDGAASR